MNLGDRLRRERLRLGLTQAELAAIGGVEPNALMRYEHGERQPRADFLAALDVVGIDLLFVVTGAKTKISVTDLAEEEQDFILRLRETPLRDRSAIMRVTASLAMSGLVRPKSAEVSR